jgi:hypothetical protein
MLLVTAACLALGAAGSRTGYAQDFNLFAYSACAIATSDPDSNYVFWTTFDPNNDPYAYPDWVGYDVMRRAGCGPEERVNADIIPRQVGMSHSAYFATEAPGGVLYEYRVVPVDADRQPVLIGPAFCSPCNVFVACPRDATPITIGTLTDLGWALLVTPCPEGCYPSAYFEGAFADELRPYAGTGTAFRFFGTLSCGTVEGCALIIDHWALAPSCGATPTSKGSWGRLKTIYR